MSTWVYKCNIHSDFERDDWDYVFNQSRPQQWGTTRIRGLRQLKSGDQILAYQTDRNEIVGIAKVVRLVRRGDHSEIILEPGERLGAKVRILKEKYPGVAKISAFQNGYPKTLYPIDASEYKVLIDAARLESNGESSSPQYWRMAFRYGTGGPELWPLCFKHKVAAICYWRSKDVDLSKYDQDRRPKSWNSHSPVEKYCLDAIAYRMKKGDVIYIKQGKFIVGRGVVTGGYFYDSKARIRKKRTEMALRHQVPVKWEKFPEPIPATLGDQQIYTVRPLNDREVARFESLRTTQLVINGHNYGAGFGDAVENRVVERAAIQFVIKRYKQDGWQVESVESECCGYDLKCTRGAKTKNLEVKGVSGEVPAFIITANELRQARSNPNFLVCVVTGASTKHPCLRELSGPELLARYRLDPLQYRAVPNLKFE